MKSLVVETISSSSYLFKGQVDLIDFSTIFPDPNDPFQWVLIIKTALRPLSFPVENKSTEVVSEDLIIHFLGFSSSTSSAKLQWKRAPLRLFFQLPKQR